MRNELKRNCYPGELCLCCVAADRKIKALIDALEELRDVQNGPPLVKYAEQWQAAFDKANALLAPRRI